MVNLPHFSLRSRRYEDIRQRLRSSRSHHTWGISFGRRRDELKQRGEPTDLQQLEELARKSVKLMEKHGTKTTQNYVKVLDLLRQQYNLNFIVVCENCNGTHSYDELSAPER
ncbi:unnamed protein product [Parnassius mnemosyne]|uniref:Uncharacterized protein n=1 Tax=Parnassius mnemosyne TaxID=213953 RepID=A0AAV1M601_9NEOP